MRPLSLIFVIMLLFLFGCDQIIPKIDLSSRTRKQKITPIVVDTSATIKQGEELEKLFAQSYKPLDYENKRQPFTSVIDVYKGNLASSISENPLETVELNQIKFTGSISGSVGNVAVLEAAGQSFYVKEGDKVGLESGVIVSISSDTVKVRQVEKDIFGNIRTVIKDIVIENKEGNL